MFHLNGRTRTLLAAAGLLVTLCAAAGCQPTGIRVTTTVDELNTDGDCSLREAVRAANLDKRWTPARPATGPTPSRWAPAPTA